MFRNGHCVNALQTRHPLTETRAGMLHTTSNLPRLGTRFALSGYIGTIRYVGEVEGTSGVWLGVEWDDSNRGKHNGTKDGKRYFTYHLVQVLLFDPFLLYNMGRPFLKRSPANT